MTAYVDIIGCGRDDCKQCRNSKEAFARIAGWNDARERARMPTVAESNSLKTAVAQIDGYFDGEIKGKKQVVDDYNAQIRALEDRIKPLRDQRNTVQKEIDTLEAARQSIKTGVESAVAPAKRGSFFYKYSRTGDSAGHYIELVDGKAECKTCPSAVYNNGSCWASKDIQNNTWGRYAHALKVTPEQFDTYVRINKRA